MAISVPKGIGPDAYQEVRVHLSQWAPIEIEPQRARRMRQAARIAQLLVFVLVLLLPSRWLTPVAFALQVLANRHVSRQVGARMANTMAKWLIVSAVVAAVKFSSWADGYLAFIRTLFFIQE